MIISAPTSPVHSEIVSIFSPIASPLQRGGGTWSCVTTNNSHTQTHQPTRKHCRPSKGGIDRAEVPSDLLNPRPAIFTKIIKRASPRRGVSVPSATSHYAFIDAAKTDSARADCCHGLCGFGRGNSGTRRPASTKLCAWAWNQ